MWEKSLKKIVNEKKHYEEAVNRGAYKEEITRLIKEVNRKLNVEVPEEYLHIISRINGIEFNGFTLYGIDEYLLECKMNQRIDGLINANQIWYENEEQKEYLFLGESNISWYVYGHKNHIFMELDNPSGRKINEFSSLYEMFNKILIDAMM